MNEILSQSEHILFNSFINSVHFSSDYMALSCSHSLHFRKNFFLKKTHKDVSNIDS